MISVAAFAALLKLIQSTTGSRLWLHAVAAFAALLKLIQSTTGSRLWLHAIAAFAADPFFRKNPEALKQSKPLIFDRKQSIFNPMDENTILSCSNSAK